jgi:hypothetical protein
MPHHFLTHGVPNTPQVKPTEDNCEAYSTVYYTTCVKCDFVPVPDLQCVAIFVCPTKPRNLPFAL